MTSSGLQGWHISLYVTVVILVIQLVVDQVLKRLYTDKDAKPAAEDSRPDAVNRRLAGKRLRVTVLVALGCIAVPLFGISFLGPTLADQLAGATGTGLGGLTLWLAWQTHKESKKLVSYLVQVSDRRSGTGRRSP
ncbi:hypothetical protein [Actinoplanes sp. G11-F43]|uniref:hypothetical protein n=1 Tax=Actinoplanes sp. G11-F43 TaxID=3424130 RepID=UPI003D33CCC6